MPQVSGLGSGASSPFGAHSQRSATGKAGEPLADEACTCCCRPAGPEQAHSANIGSSAC